MIAQTVVLSCLTSGDPADLLLVLLASNSWADAPDATTGQHRRYTADERAVNEALRTALRPIRQRAERARTRRALRDAEHRARETRDLCEIACNQAGVQFHGQLSVPRVPNPAGASALADAKELLRTGRSLEETWAVGSNKHKEVFFS